MADTHSRRVLVHTVALPVSQTFVVDQVRHLNRWRPELTTRAHAIDGLDPSDLLASEMHSAPALGSWADRRLRMTRSIPHLRAAADRMQPALVHAHFLTAGFEVVRTLGSTFPIVITAHGFDATWHGDIRRTQRPVQLAHGLQRAILLRRPVLFIAVSTFIADTLVSLGAARDRVVVHRTGIDTGRFVPPGQGASRSGILFAGRLVPKKGVDDLLEAVALLPEDLRSVPVEIIGDGPERPLLERKAAQLGVETTFRGSCEWHEVRDAMQRCAVLCSPSRTDATGDREGFGMVLAEAQSCGSPVVATRCGGMTDAVDHGRTGFLVAERRPDEVASALTSLLRDDGRRVAMGRAGRRWVSEHFDVARQTALLEDIYDDWRERASR